MMLRLAAAIALAATASAQGILEPPRAACPLSSGTYNELYAVAVYLADTDRMEEAELCLTDALAATVPAFQMLSDLTTRKQEHPRAALIAGLIDKLVNNADAKLYYAKKLLQNNEHQLAMEILDGVAVGNPDIAGIRHLLGVACFGSGKNEEAIANLKRAVELEPEVELYKTELEMLTKAIAGELPEQVEAAAKAAAEADNSV